MAISGTFLPNSGLLSVFGDAQSNTVTLSRDAAGKILINGGAVPVLGGTATVANTGLMQVFGQTGAASRVLQTDGEDMQNRDHSCFFSAAHAAKDSGIALRLAEESALNLPLARETKAQYDRMVACGLGELDKSGIAELTFKGRHPKV